MEEEERGAGQGALPAIGAWSVPPSHLPCCVPFIEPCVSPLFVFGRSLHVATSLGLHSHRSVPLRPCLCAHLRSPLWRAPLDRSVLGSAGFGQCQLYARKREGQAVDQTHLFPPLEVKLWRALDAVPRREIVEQGEQHVVDHDDDAHDLAEDGARAVVPAQRSGESAHRRAPSHCEPEQESAPPESLNDRHARHAHRGVVHALSPLGDVGPRVDGAELGMRRERVVCARADVRDGARDGADQVCGRRDPSISAGRATTTRKAPIGETPHAPSTSGSANSTSPGGSTSGTPPTRVETTKRPAHAASRMPIPNASVRDGLRKICARARSCGVRLRVSVRLVSAGAEGQDALRARPRA